VRAAYESLGKPTDLVVIGVRVLVRSASAYAGLRLPSAVGVPLRTTDDRINAIFRNLPRRAGCWGQDFRADAFAERLSDRLKAVVESSLHIDADRSSLTARHQAIVAAACAWRSSGQRGSPTLANKSCAPYEVIDSVHRLLGGRQAEEVLTAQDTIAVAALGLAYGGLASMTRCYWCFRWAYPGQSRCTFHSLAGEVPGSAKEKQRRYKEALVVSGKIGMSGFSQSPRYFRFSASDIHWGVARTTWGTTLAREEAVRQRLMDALGRSPRLCAAAAKDKVDLLSIDPIRIVDELRNWLDPAEFRPKVLVQEVYAAERWYRCASEALPGRRGTGRRKEDRIDAALELAGVPGATLPSVAAALQISRSTISKWFVRYAERRDVRRLHRLLAPRGYRNSIVKLASARAATEAAKGSQTADLRSRGGSWRLCRMPAVTDRHKPATAESA